MNNIALIYLKMNENQKCLDFCDRAIEKIKLFTRFTNFNPKVFIYIFFYNTQI